MANIDEIQDKDFQKLSLTCIKSIPDKEFPSVGEMRAYMEKQRLASQGLQANDVAARKLNLVKQR